jgi:transcriptional regulator with XRE-family HTH domain
VAFSRRLGYHGNVAAKWEGGHRFPTFSEAVRAALRVGIDPLQALQSFHAPSAEHYDPSNLGPWLSALRGSESQQALAQRTGLSRQQVGRLLSGRSRGRLPEVMRLVDAMTGRLPDLVGAFVPIDEVPALAVEAQVRAALSRLAISHPWSPAAQAWLDSRKRVPVASAAEELSAAVGIAPPEATALLDALVAAGAAVRSHGSVRPAPPTTVEVSATSEEFRQIRAHWASVSSDRVARGEPGDLFSFNVFAIGREDLERVKEAQRRFYREVRAIVSESTPEVAAMLVVHTASFEA